MLLTADRPWELHGFGAPQTIDQSNLFGRSVRVVESLPTPDESALAHLPSVVGRVLALGRDGPVHFNVPFREPLASPEGTPGPVINPEIAVFASSRNPPDLTSVTSAIRAAKRGLIVCA